jgi:hypothetical protein
MLANQNLEPRTQQQQQQQQQQQSQPYHLKTTYSMWHRSTIVLPAFLSKAVMSEEAATIK